MQPRPLSTIVVTERDAERLRMLLKREGHRHDRALVRGLELVLSHAFVVHPKSVAPDIVTMNSRVRFRDPQRSSAAQRRLVYPGASDHPNHVPVLSALGLALLGARVGQTALWSSERREVRRLRVVALPYQPERAGHFDL